MLRATLKIRCAAGLIAALLPAMCSVAHADIWSGLIGWWKLDEANAGACGGASVMDSSRTASTGTCSGSPTWVTGRIGQGAMYFNGTTDYVTMANAASYSNLATMSWAGWYYQTASSSNPIIMEKSSAGTSWRVLCGSGKPSLAVKTTNDGWYTAGALVGGGVGSMNSWHHFVFTYDGSYLRQYQDGAYVTISSPAISGNIFGTATAVAIAHQDAVNTNYFTGYLDDIRIYNRALSDTDVAMLYQYGRLNLRNTTLNNFNAN